MVKIAIVLIVGFLLLWIIRRILSRPKNIVRAALDDETLNSAKSQARETVHLLLAALASPQTNQTDVTVKKEFQLPDKSSEHLWLNNLTYDGNLIHGEVANEPAHLESVNIGDKTSVSPKDISDWKFLEDNVLVGGYTIRVFYDRMDDKQKAQFLSEVDFNIE